MVTAAYYPVNDTSLPASERAYLQQLENYAAQQDLEQDLRPNVRALSVAFTVLAAAVVGLRFVARHRQGAPYGVDDWLILVSLALLGGNLVFNLVMVNQGLGLHSGRLTLQELELLDQTVVGAEIIYVTAVNMYKISLLFLYFRIFPLPSIRKWSYVCGGLTSAWNVACIFAASFQCSPRNKIWEPWVGGYCINLFLAQLCIAVPSILCDIAILCLPLPHILRLKTNLTQKIFLVVIFLLGSYVVFTSIYRFVVYLSYSRSDVPYTLATPCAWNVIEISSGIVSSCLPTLGPIVRPIIKSVMPSTMGMSGGDTSYGGAKRRGGSHPGLVTIGGGGGSSYARQSKGGGGGKWSRFDRSATGSRITDEQYLGVSEEDDVEMEPRGTTVTVISAGQHKKNSSPSPSPEPKLTSTVDHRLSGSLGTTGKSGVMGGGGGGGGGPMVLTTTCTAQRDSDEYPMIGGITQTVEVEWSVETTTKPHQQHGGR